MSTESSALHAVPVERPLRPMAMLRRRRVSLLVAMLVVASVTVVVAFLWPPTYVSTGTILIEQQEVPTDLVRSTISSYADQRIQMINQRVVTTENLLGIIQRYDLYPEERKRKGRETIIEQMRKDLKFRTISADVIDPRQGRPVQATIAFSVGFQSSSADLAVRVANELASLYLRENLETRKQLTADTANFLSEESQKLSVRIAELEGSLATFKSQNVNSLPEVGPVNLQLVSRADDERRDVDMQVRAADQQILFLESQLAQLSPTAQVFTSTGERVLTPADRIKVLRSELASARAIYAPNHPDVQRLQRELEGLAAGAPPTAASDNERVRQLHDAEAQLAVARQRYAADHPDVIRLERLVASFATRDPVAAAGSAAPASTSNEAADNPPYVQLQTQLEAARIGRRLLDSRRMELRARLSELEQRLANAPGIERDYAAMVRELEGSQQKYREVRAKQMEAQLSENLEIARKGERFTLIEPPLAPQEPTSPNRPLILAFGLVLALVAGLVTALLRDSTDDRVRDQADVASLLTAPPLAVVPWIVTAAERTQRRRLQIYALAGSIVALGVGITATHFLYRPLDVLWAVSLRRLGV
jgi:uncharacterized protein involved in exopolysaccharide biosynthesis